MNMSDSSGSDGQAADKPSREVRVHKDGEPRRCWRCGAQPEAMRVGSYWRIGCMGEGRHSSSPIFGHTMKNKRDAIREWNLLGDAETLAEEQQQGNRA